MSGTPSLDSMLQLGRVDNDGNVGTPILPTETDSDQSLSPNDADADAANAREAQDVAPPLFSEQTSQDVNSTERRSTLALQKSLQKYGERVNSSRTLRHQTSRLTPVVDHDMAGGYVLFSRFPDYSSPLQKEKHIMIIIIVSLCVCEREREREHPDY